MGTAAAKPAIWILLSKKWTVKQLLAAGYKPGAVYSYKAKYPAVAAEVQAAVKKAKNAGEVKS